MGSLSPLRIIVLCRAPIFFLMGILQQCPLGCMVRWVVIVIVNVIIVISLYYCCGFFFAESKDQQTTAATIYCRVSRYLLTLLVVIT